MCVRACGSNKIILMINLLLVPYDSALRGVRMGAGPQALLQAGLKERLQDDGRTILVTELDPPSAFHAEISTAFELHRIVREAVASGTKDNRLSIVLTGNCNTGVVGCLAAHDADDVGLFWFDAHSDAETPETSTSGFFDGMGFALTLGACWRSKLEELGWHGLDGVRSALIAAREITPAARSLLEGRGVSIASPENARSRSSAAVLADAVAQFRSAGVRRVHVHVDLDVLDPDLVGPANSYALPFGLTVDQLVGQIRVILREFPLASASVASYDPSVDVDGAVAAGGIEAIVVLASGHRPSVAA
jgi:arginase